MYDSIILSRGELGQWGLSKGSSYAVECRMYGILFDSFVGGTHKYSDYSTLFRQEMNWGLSKGSSYAVECTNLQFIQQDGIQ